MIKRMFVFTYPCPRKLREVIKMSLIERETSVNIKSIWNQYHIGRPNNVSAVITSTQYQTLAKRLGESQFFIFPLKRESGYFFMLSQSQEKSNLFTFLEDFKKNPNQATPYFVLTLFDELILQKGLVLIRGDIIDNLITKTEADNLLASFLSYYVESGLYDEYVFRFNHKPDQFNHESHVSHYFSRFNR